MKKKLGWLAALGIGGLGVVLAQPPEGRPPEDQPPRRERPRDGEGPRDGERPRGEGRGPGRLDDRPTEGPRGPHPLIAALDANQDHQISADEMAAAAQRLKSLDRNGDGVLTPDEFDGGRHGR
ncbi:MAG: hypothetical protein ACKN9U_13375, partial [Pirellulaceae bacterium]